MGHAYTYRCEHCGFEDQFNQGHGFLIHSRPVTEYLNLKIRLFHYKVHLLLKSLAQQNKSLYVKAGFQVYKCPRCKILYDKIAVVVYDNEEVVHKSDFRCPLCRARLKLTNMHRLKNAVCPVCFHKTFRMEYKHPQLWD